VLLGLTITTAAVAVWWNHEGQWIGVGFLIGGYLLVSCAVLIGDYVFRSVRRSAARAR
jgi:hypothetical protein